jgi:DNA repair exonuclease SbcCD nuclease subunit
MTKYAIITDTHAGGRGDSLVFNEFFFKFWEGTFFPYLEKHGIKHVIHMGDVVDRRKFINFAVSDSWHKRFFKVFEDREISLKVIIGNHDTFYKNTNDVNCMNQIFWGYKNVEVFSEAQDVFLSEETPTRPYAFIPWINSGNYQKTMDYLANTSAQIAFGHLEISGFEMDVGNVCDSGFTRKTFDKFETVFTGHFHHKSSDGKIFYLGNTYQITWADYGERRGFHVYDTESQVLDFVPNPNMMFHKLTYDDSTPEGRSEILHVTSSGMVIPVLQAAIKGTYVKIIVVNKTDPHLYDLFMDCIQKMEPFEVTTAEDFSVAVGMDDEELDDLEESTDTVSVLNKYIDALEANSALPQNITGIRTKNVLRELYVEAVNIENTNTASDD